MSGSDLLMFMATLMWYRLPLNLIILKALNKTMHAILCAFFISVNKLMLASFRHNYEVCKTDY